MKEIVFIYKDGKAIQTDIETGIQDAEYIQVKSGLNENESVISAPYSLISKVLKNNMSVEKVDFKDLYSDNKKKR
jgi:HlyD family secretion protein